MALLDGGEESSRLLPGRAPTKRALLEHIPSEILSRFHAGWNEESVAADPAREAEWLATLDWLDILKGFGLVQLELGCGQEKLVTLIPHGGQFDMPDAIKAPEGLEAKPFLYARPSPDGLALNEPDTPVTAILHSPDLRELLLSGQSLDLELADTITVEICGRLAALGFLQPKNAAPRISATWEFHDRLMHSQIRMQDRINGYGASYRFGSDPVSPEAPLPTEEGIALPDATETGKAFSDVLRNRRSNRHIGKQPVTLAMLGDLLARAWRDVASDSLSGVRRVFRPFPSGGAIHELELTVLARYVEGLEPGAYRYCSRTHKLRPIPVCDETIDQLCDQIGTGPGTSGGALGCLMVVSSRLPKLARVYEKIAMKLTLMNSGAALQTLQLAATNLGLNSWIVGAVPALGVGDGSLDAEEFPIASFAIGRTS